MAPSDETDTLFLHNLTCEGTHIVTLGQNTSENYPIIYGFFKYRDPFRSDEETRFGYRLKVDGSIERIKSIAYNNNS